MAKIGRPTDYSIELTSEFCSRLTEGRSVRSICEDDDMPDKATIFKWLAIYPEFKDQYAKAKEEAVEALVNECFDIADENALDYTEDKEGNLRPNIDHIQRARLRIDTRKWYVSKILPKKYGDRQIVDQTTHHTFESMTDDEIDARLKAKLASVTDKNDQK